MIVDNRPGHYRPGESAAFTITRHKNAPGFAARGLPETLG